MEIDSQFLNCSSRQHHLHYSVLGNSTGSALPSSIVQGLCDYCAEAPIIHHHVCSPE